jgi:NAD(P)H-hydrate epimerase
MTPEKMRSIDEAAIAAGTPGLVLMERAGQGATRILLEQEDWLWGCTLILCGKGNNGGDGLVVARLLHGEGYQVRALLSSPSSELGADARTNLRRAREIGVVVDVLEEDQTAALDRIHRESPGRLLIDALLGTGFHPPLRPPLKELCAKAAELSRRIVALDGPTGLDGTTGAIDEDTPVADLTVCLGFPKWGHVLRPGRGHCGRLSRVDLELPQELVEREVRGSEDVALYVDRLLAAAWWQERPIQAHKYSAGSVLCVGASAGMSGAMALACNGAHRAGAGLVEAVVPGSVRNAVDVHCVETLVHGAAETASGCLSPSSHAEVEQRLDGKGALLVGPGGGSDLETAEFFIALASAGNCPTVVDADALNAFARLQRKPSFEAATVLTPHSGELSRLLGLSAEEIEADRVSVLCEAAARWNCVLLHKGAPTFVAAPDGSLAVVGSGGPGLATAGSGDILAGCIAALLSAGQDPFKAACLSAYMHGRAGDRLERTRGVASVMARDLLEELSSVVFEIESWRR